MGIKEYFEHAMENRKKTMQAEREQKQKRAVAYKEEYNKARIEGAKRAGRREGLARSSQRSGGHGILAGLGTAGNYALGVQSNMADMFGLSSPAPRRSAPTHHKRSSSGKTITIKVEGGSRSSHPHKKKKQSQSYSMWDL